MAHVEIVRELMVKVAAERGLTDPITIRPLNSGGGNYTSALFSASAGDLKVFAKIAILGEKMREVMNAEMMFKTEQIVYSELAATYEDLQKKNEGAAPFRFPTVYARLPDVGNETILMEDLTAKGYRTPTRQEPIDWRFATAAVSKMAAFHALSFAYEKDNPASFTKMAERLKYIEREKRDEVTLGAWTKMIGGALQVVQDDHRPKLEKLLSDLKIFTTFRSPKSRVVFTHGDYRPSNLLFKEQDGNLDIIVVDYQTVHSGCPVSDLLYFTFLGTDQQFRRNHYKDLLDHYHRELSVALDGLGVDVEEVYPKEVFINEVQEMVPAALAMSVVLLPIVMVDEAAAPQIAGDVDISQFAIKPSASFAERFAALVADCVEWGAI